jgi:hypothetical protein
VAAASSPPVRVIACKRAPIIHRAPKLIAHDKNRRPTRFRRFVRKIGFGERRCGAKPLSMKIFLLPNFATQSPRNAVPAVTLLAKSSLAS